METIKKRFIKLIDGIFKIAVLSWVCLIIVAVKTADKDGVTNAAKLFELPFLSYTAAVYGLKLFFDNVKKIKGGEL